MRYPSGSAGFTVTELLIATAVTGLVAVVAMAFMMGQIANYFELSTRASLLTQAHAALNVIGNDIRLSAVADANNRIADPNAPAAPANEFSWASDADTLVLAAVAEDADRAILFEDASQYISYKNNIVFYLENGRLYKRILAAPVAGNAENTSCPPAVATDSCRADRMILDKVTAFTARYLDGNDEETEPTSARSVELTVSLADRKFGRDFSVDYSTRTVFRND